MAGLSRAYKRRGTGMRASVLSMLPQVWVDATAPNTLFTDTSGTIPATANGDSIGRWNDISGNNRHTTAASATNRPILLKGAWSGLNTISSTTPSGGPNSGRTYLATSTLDWSAFSVGTIIAVLYRTDYSNYDAVVSVGNYQTVGGIALTSGVSTYARCGGMMGGNPYQFWESTSVNLDQSVQVIVTQFSPQATGLDRLKVWRNGTPVAMNNPGGGNFSNLSSASPFAVFGRTDGWTFNGQIAESILFCRGLSVDELAAISGYLKSKWSVSS